MPSNCLLILKEGISCSQKFFGLTPRIVWIYPPLHPLIFFVLSKWCRWLEWRGIYLGLFSELKQLALTPRGQERCGLENFLFNSASILKKLFKKMFLKNRQSSNLALVKQQKVTKFVQTVNCFEVQKFKLQKCLAEWRVRKRCPRQKSLDI